MTRKTVTVFGATGTAGVACVNELIEHKDFDVCVLARKPGQQERSSSGMTQDEAAKQSQYVAWAAKGVSIKAVDSTLTEELIPALEGTDYVVSCVPISATESQYPLIFAAREAGVERFVPSEFGAIYEFEQFWPTNTTHRLVFLERTTGSARELSGAQSLSRLPGRGRVARRCLMKSRPLGESHAVYTTPLCR